MSEQEKQPLIFDMFVPEEMNINPLIVIIGKRRSGMGWIRMDHDRMINTNIIVSSPG